MSRGAFVFRLLCVAFAFAFAYAAVVQLNDPDPLVWISVYSVAGAASLVAAFSFPLPERGVWFVLGLAVASLLGALAQVPRVVATAPPFGEVLSDMQMMQPGVEEAREGLGLLLVALWLGILARVSWIKNRRNDAR